MNSSFHGGGAHVDANPAEGRGCCAEHGASDRPDCERAARSDGAFVHGGAEALLMALLVRQRLFEPRNKVWVFPPGACQLRRVDCDGAVFTGVIYAK